MHFRFIFYYENSNIVINFLESLISILFSFCTFVLPSDNSCTRVEFFHAVLFWFGHLPTCFSKSRNLSFWARKKLENIWIFAPKLLFVMIYLSHIESICNFGFKIQIFWYISKAIIDFSRQNGTIYSNATTIFHFLPKTAASIRVRLNIEGIE